MTYRNRILTRKRVRRVKFTELGNKATAYVCAGILEVDPIDHGQDILHRLEYWMLKFAIIPQFFILAR